MKRRKISAVVWSAFICFLFASSCSYVKPDNSDNSNWYDGLNNQQIIEGMMMYACENPLSQSTITTTGIEKDIIVSWSIPLLVEDWTVWYSLSGIDGEWTMITSSTVSKISEEPDETGMYTYGFKYTVNFTEENFIVFFKVEMNDSDDEDYENTVSYMLSPCDGTMRITIDSVEADAISSIYFVDPSQSQPEQELTAGSELLISNVNENVGENTERSVAKWDKIQFANISDFRSVSGWLGDDLILHYSNTSYYRTLACSNDNGIPSLTLSFEDLPLEMLSSEPGGHFDYDDVVFHVEFFEVSADE